jgi:predicted GNAT superfamily acetyltransferase
MSESTPGPNFDDDITIRRAETLAEYRAVQETQRQAWGVESEGYLIPVATMVGANLHGGLVLGAFLPRGAAVAMSFAFLGRLDGRLCLYSQLTGVVPAYQSRGLGYRIKLCQRDIARAEGIDCIAWAFDPLQAGNAHFNLARLGATSGCYRDNMYGERTDALNAGVPTDRLIAEWQIAPGSPIFVPPEGLARLPRLIETAPVEGTGLLAGPIAPLGFACPTPPDSPHLLLEIPSDIARLRREQPHVAEAWRAAVRDAFQFAFEHSYRAVGFVRVETGEHRRGFYVLQRLQSMIQSQCEVSQPVRPVGPG